MTATDPVQVLAGIWTELLGRDRIGLDEDFFQIGGDSILSVGVAARAARSGVPITPQDVLRNPTLRGLAAVAPSAGGARPVVESSGPVLPTPLVKQLLDEADDPSDFVVVEVLSVAAGVRSDAVRAAVDRLTAIQEPLRYRFRRNALGWRIERAEEAGHLFDSVVLPPMDADAELALFTEDQGELRRDVHVTRGPLLRARFYDRGPRRAGVLLLLVHHFAYDEVSTVPLLEDLNAALAGDATEVRPAAWRSWSRKLHDLAQSDELAGELTYWTSVLRGGQVVPRAPRLASAGEPGVVHRRVRVDGLADLLTRPGAPGREAVLAVVACAWSRWRGEPNAFLSTVGHGTPNAFRDEDRSQSLGWFTNSYPLLLPVEPGAGVADALTGIVDALRAVPNDGVGYGVLRHLSPETDAVTRLRSLPEPELLVEHKVGGAATIRVGDGPVQISGAPIAGTSTALLAAVPIMLATAVVDGELQLYVVHHGRYDPAGLDDFADHLVRAVTELAASGRQR